MVIANSPPRDLPTTGAPRSAHRGEGVDPNDPVFQAVIAPFFVAFIIVALSRLVGGKRGDLLAGAGVVVGALIGYALFAGVPQFPPPASTQKLFYLIALGGSVGFVVDLVGRPTALDRLAILAVPAFGVLWLAWRQLAAGPEWEAILTSLLIWVASVAWLWRLGDGDDKGGAVTAGILLIASAIGTAGIAFIAPSATLPLFAAALAAATGAFVVWGYGAQIIGTSRPGFTRAALLGLGGGLSVIVQILVSFTPHANIPALIGVLLVPFCEPIARRLRFGGGRLAATAGPIALGIVAAVPALGAIGFAYVMSTGTM